MSRAMASARGSVSHSPLEVDDLVVEVDVLDARDIGDGALAQVDLHSHFLLKAVGIAWMTGLSCSQFMSMPTPTISNSTPRSSGPINHESDPGGAKPMFARSLGQLQLTPQRCDNTALCSTETA